ncbi:hypothetical protein [Lichenihabitans sp. Uapishka_5]|uniref:hypothetical protein n=1 Tax=Lichenihabitans sp. Uapishka_5 TaxID=3037302 RepID=UPI0029E7D480|nr:hypothetical protein [Lichenihabitans sp. Uapishka_5]
MHSDAARAYVVALGYVQSMAAIMGGNTRQQTEDDIPFVLAFHMLAGFAVELYLKSYLYFTGHDENELRGPNLRHNLSNLLEKSKADGLINEGADFLVDYLNDHHASFEFRYMKSASTYPVRSLNSIFEAFSSLDVYVDTKVGASVSQGRTPKGGWPFSPDNNWRMPVSS